MRLMLGNQVLLRKSHNRQIGNRPFSVKKRVLAASDLVLTQEVGNEVDWTPAAIRERQARMAELAVSVWRRT